MQEVAEAVRKLIGERQAVLMGRVTDVKGFSTLAIDEIVAIDEGGHQYGELLGRPGAERLGQAAQELFREGGVRLAPVVIEIHGQEVAEIGLSCGGQAEVLLQPVSCIPLQLWDLLAERAPVALATVVSGPEAGPSALVFDRDGESWGGGGGSLDDPGVGTAAADLLSGGRSWTRRLEVAGGESVVLVEAWVPAPRLVVVGAGEMVEAVAAQGRLLGWETQSTEGAADVGGLLDWAGATAALIVLSHDPHVDAPALRTGLERGVPYVGAMGSRSTQSRRLERLRREGVPDAQLDRIHRPIGLDLGGRRAPEVALAIAAEILANHCGRQGRSLKDTSGPIHGAG